MPVRLAESQALMDASVTYRAQVSLGGSRDLARLQALGVSILDQQEETATVLAPEGQLEDLAKLRIVKVDAWSEASIYPMYWAVC